MAATPRKPKATTTRRKPPARKPAARKAAPSRARAAKRPGARKPALIRGMHALFYSNEPEALRKFLRDMLGLAGTDVGEGWLIMDIPEADLGVHPIEATGRPHSGDMHLSFYCDDIESTMRELVRRGVEFTQHVEDQGWGLVAKMRVPGGFDVQLYQPRYSK
jgi:hypothetical protein